MAILGGGAVSYERGAPVGSKIDVCIPNLVTEAGSYLRLIDSCITQLKAQGPSRTCNESKEEEELPDFEVEPAEGEEHVDLVQSLG